MQKPMFKMVLKIWWPFPNTTHDHHPPLLKFRHDDVVSVSIIAESQSISMIFSVTNYFMPQIDKFWSKMAKIEYFIGQNSVFRKRQKSRKFRGNVLECIYKNLVTLIISLKETFD